MDSPEMRAAVEAEVAAFTPAAVPPFDAIRRRKRTRDRQFGLVAASVVTTLALGTAALATLPGERPAPDAAGAPGGKRVACQFGPPFEVAALSGPADAERGTDAAATALRNFVTASDGFPRGGWRAVARTPDEVLYVARDLKGVVVVRHEGGGFWAVKEADDGCEAYAAPPAGRNPAIWTLREPGRPVDRTFTADVGEIGCGGGAPDGRVDPPLVEYTETTVVVTFFVRRAGDDLPPTCRNNPTAPYEVTLREPLGGRTLLDGGPYPPLPATRRNPVHAPPQ